MSLLRTNVKAHKGRFAPDQAPSGYGPSDLQSAYNLPSATAGSGETVAVVDAYNDPDIAADLATYRAQYGLPACTTASGCFQVVNQDGQASPLPPDAGSTGWDVEESLDVDMVSAACPNCHILLVEADSNANSDLYTAEDEAVTLGSKYVSNSWSSCEYSGETADDQYFNHPGVAITASGGDDGYDNYLQGCDSPSYPAASPDVTSVGGTTLTQDASTARGWTETAWSPDPDATGSGCSQYEPKPSWQADTGCAGRMTNDVSADADPQTGAAVYDSYSEGGWLEVGGTSEGSPIIAATYALAGTPLAGTNPASYPYVNASGGLNDVTSGTNYDASCTPAYFCTAGPGYDGPTGLGTPDGTSAFTPATSGTLTGTVTAAATGKPVSGATVSVGHVSATTTSSGGYSLDLAPGSYKVAMTTYGYVAQTATVQVTAGQASTQNFALATAPEVTLSGTVTDGSGHKWPLYAKITVPGTPLQTVYTNPGTGQYSMRIAGEVTYTLDVAPVSPGYTTATATVKIGTANVTKNVKVLVNTSICDAFGYAARYDGAGTQFTGWTGDTPKDGWTVTANSGGNGDTWRFGSDPTNEEGQGNGNPAPPGSSGDYAIADSYYYNTGTLDTSLVSPVVNLSGVPDPQIGFDSWYYEYGDPPESAEVDLSLDGGQTWTSVWRQTTSSQQGPVTIPIPQAAGQSDVQVRFTYTGTYDWWWSLDNIVIGTQTCAPVPGGLVAGTVSDANTGQPVNGATITETGRPRSAVTSAATGAPAIPGGFYEMFSPAGSHSFTATETGYATATATVDVTRNAVTSWSWKLQAGHLTMTPATASVTEPLGAAKTIQLALANNGAQPVQVTLGAQDGGFAPTGGPRDGGLAPPVNGSKPSSRQSGTEWSKIAKYPIPIKWNAVAYEPLTGDIYSIGGNTVTSYATDKGFVYKPATGAWAAIAPAPIALIHAYATFADGTLYLVGGENANQDPVSAMYAYSPELNTWSQVASLPDALYGGADAVLDGDLYVVGGCDAASSSSGLCTAGSQAAYRYDPVTNVWTQIADYLIPVQEEACAGIDGEVVCAGGNSSNSQSGVGTNATYLYDPASNTWSQGADLPFPDSGMAYAGAGGDLQIAAGEEDFGQRAPAVQYDPATNTWSSLPKSLYNVSGGGGSCGLYQIGGGTVKPISVGGIQEAGIPTRDAAVLPGYDQCDGAGALSWLSESQDSLTVAPGQSVTVSVQMNSAAVSQPGSYQAVLYASTDAPYPPSVASLTMNVKPAQGMREVSGTVTAAGGHPLAGTMGATVAIAAVGQTTAAAKTNGFGRYEWWLAAGSGAVQVSAAKDGYQPQAVTAAPAPGAPATVNFTLKPDPGTLPYTGTASKSAAAGRAKTSAAMVPATDTAHVGRERPRLPSAPDSRGVSAAGHQQVKSSPSSRSGLPADVKAVCGTPAKGHAACMALLRTDIKPHKGRFGPNQAPSGYGPSDLRSAYDLSSSTAGSGETVAVVDAGDDPTAEADLGVYRAQYGLPPCTTANGCFEKVNEEGQQGSYPPTIGTWPVEESLDVDMVSAICPNCHIILVEANSTSIADLGTSVDEAVALGAKFVSNSYGTDGEVSGETSYDQYYNHPGVAVTASAGDSGYGVHYPAASQYVTSVGGTTLTQDPGTARGWTETTWSGTGSGCSVYEPKPAWQTDTGCGMRTDNDVSADANPSTGVAFYDSGDGGWSVVGGTSVASPIIASTFALAGTPAVGTYPSSYPYVNTGGGLNDVTSGSDGTCTPSYLCTAGPGYDGPTGLGTPDGISAFTPASYGTLSGTVTSKATGDPLAGATVTVGSRSTTTDSSGHYTLDVAAGSYSMTTSLYEYDTQTATGVQVTAGQTTTQNFTLAQAKVATISGTVSDGSGHKWPLYAEITVAGTPLAPVYTSPYTGDYSITLPGQASYALTVTPVYPGYSTVTDTVKVGRKDMTRNIKVAADKASCDAPGYGFKYNGTDEQFTSWDSTTPQDGWTVTDNNGTGYGWEFDDASGFGNSTGGTGGFAEAETYTGPIQGAVEDTSLVSPVVNLSKNTAPQISFDQYGIWSSGWTGAVDLSLDGGSTWQTVWGPATDFGQSAVAVPIPQAAGQSDVMVRFTFIGSGFAGWQLDNILIGAQSCHLIQGGLVAGVVTDANTGNPVNGATITEAGKHRGTGTSATTGDPANPGGFYWLFSPTGQQSLTATNAGYATATATAGVTGDAVTRQDWVLQAGRLTVTSAASSVTETLGQDKTVKLTYTNTGGSALQVALGAQDGGYTPTAGASGGTAASTGPAHPAWSSIASLPVGVEDNAVATDPQTGDVYSVGGYNSESQTTSAGYVYNPSGGQWSPIATAPQALSQAGAAFIDGTLYLIGGETPYGYPVSTVYAYNPGANAWSQMASLPQAVASPGVAVLDGQLYVVGGCFQSSGEQGCAGEEASAAYRYDPVTNSWARFAHYPLAVGAQACAGIDGEIACTGGQTSTGPSSATWLYNPRGNHWTQGADLPYPDQEMAYAGANGKLQVAGGVIGEVNNNTTYTTRVSQYDPATNTWASLPPLGAPISDSGGSCGIYVIGGFDAQLSESYRVLQAAEHLPGYDQCDGAGAPSWVKPSATSLTLAPGASATVTARLDSAKVTQPGTYQAMIYAAANAPYPVQVAPVTMVVQPPAGWILMSGKVTDAAGNPIAGATVQIDTSVSSVKTGPVDFTVITGTNGRYQGWLDPSADDPLQVIAAKDGYVQQVVSVTKPKASLKFALNPFPSVPY